MIITLTGSNAYLLQSELRRITNQFISTSGDMGLERVDAGQVEYTRIIEVVHALPFLADKRLVIIDGPANNKQLAENIADLLVAIDDLTDVVFTEPKFDKRSLLYKTLNKKTDYKEFNELDDSKMANWLSQYAKEQDGQLSSSDARYLIQRVGLNQLRLKNELDKLVSFNKNVDRNGINLLVAPNPDSKVFDLLDAALSGQPKKAMELYAEQRLQKVEPQAILALFAWQLHVLAVVKSAGNRQSDAVTKDSKLNPFVIRKSAGLARRLSAEELKSLIRRTLELDIKLKTESIDADTAMQNLLVGIA